MARPGWPAKLSEIVRRTAGVAGCRDAVTVDELNSLLPSLDFSPSEIEDIYNAPAAMGIWIEEGEPKPDPPDRAGG